MPTFETVNPADVAIGRGRAAHELRQQFREAIRGAQAGRVTLERTDRASTIKRVLTEAAKEEGMRVRSSWTDKKQTVLEWKLVGV